MMLQPLQALQQIAIRCIRLCCHVVERYICVFIIVMDVVDLLKDEILNLRKKLMEKEAVLRQHQTQMYEKAEEKGLYKKLTNVEIDRYSRQIIMPEIGMKGQQALKNSSVLVVGAGGLGCPSALYLTGAGVGHIGIVDYDKVKLNNLHRQLLHPETSTGQPKVLSAFNSLKRLNSFVHITPYDMQLDSTNALDAIRDYDVVVDATDNVATRYLLNDACVLTDRPLVSGSALQLEGQLTVYNYNNGPCYRCLFPVPPPPETVTNCGDGGVLGAGVIGVLQALETLKILLGHQGVVTKKLLLFDASDCSFRNVRLRDRNPSCAICGNEPSITALVDYEQFCGSKANDKHNSIHLLDNVDRISTGTYHDVRSEPHILIDVRSPLEFEICHLPGSLNVPLKDLASEQLVQPLKEVITKKGSSDKDFPVFVVCRRGNDSQKGVLALRETLSGLNVSVKDIIGGLHSWAKDIDPSFPVY
ncbi:adenylyltransferase and sulfurtransferase MOCS3 isoform X2 [Cryptotermes secundus]|uniref:adenylyltransferase and sulfurtransferase MOCS3 isoform X2 n=1 Tax=Cryptotermes secundus TaxID=105785 RepID=UPI001454CDB3|nr:adenylyltransferase and sulfurtransferase MOCS3 isoform X2 [Cryptotermes secundus]